MNREKAKHHKNLQGQSQRKADKILDQYLKLNEDEDHNVRTVSKHTKVILGRSDIEISKQDSFGEPQRIFLTHDEARELKKILGKVI